MAEPKRIDDENNSDDLTLNDAEERRQQGRNREGRPQLLRSEARTPSDTGNVPVSRTEDEMADPKNPTRFSAVSTEYAETSINPGGAPSRSEGDPAVDQPVLLFADTDVSGYRSRWSNIQAGFVDEPRQAVEDADNLVKSVLEKLSRGFTHERDRLAKQWDRGENVSTEDLRVALQRYRSFFDRLLNV